MVRVIAATLAAVAGLSAAQYTGQTCVAIRDGNNIGNCAFPFDANGNGESTVCAPDGSNPRWCSIAYDYVSTDWGICQCSCNAGYSEIDGYTNNGEPGTGHCEADTDDLNDEGEINDINDLVRMLNGHEQPSGGPGTTMPMAPAPAPMASSGPVTTAAPDEREEREEHEEHEEHEGHEEPEEDHRPEWVEYTGEELPVGSACLNNGFTPNVTLSFTCSGITSDECCSMEGRNEDRGEEGSVCQFDHIESDDHYADVQTACTEAGGTGAAGNTCQNNYPREFPGVDWCQRRRCEHCGHTWADEISHGVSRCCGGQGTVCDEAGSGGASVEPVCTNADDFMRDLVLRNDCVGVTEEACCGLGGHFSIQGHNDCNPEGVGVCGMETGATPAPAPATSSNNNATTMAPDTANSTTTPASSSRRLTQQEACAAAGGTFEPTDSTCAQRLMHARGWGGVATCSDRACPDCGHTVADEIRGMIRQGCCGSGTFVCDPASEGDPADWCETPADWTPDFVREVNCRGLTQAECCDAGGEFEDRGEDTCGDACRFERERSTDPDPMETCTSAGGTVDRAETCASLASHLGGFPGSAQCDARARPNSDDDSTVANYASYLGSLCCGQTRSNVCGASSTPSEDLCQDPDSFMASASHNVKCMGITEAACRTLHREQCPTDTVDMSLCLRRMEFEEAEEGEGCGTTECEYVTSVGSDTAEDRCVAAGGTVRQAETCDSWAQGAIGHVGAFALFAQGSTTRPNVDCGGFIGEENINYHFFLAGSACCSDGYSQCMGVDVHVVSASMTLGITFPANMSEGQLQEAVIASIAAQTGLNASRGEIGNVTVTVKVVGTAPMVVADPAAFIASTEAKMAVEAGLAAKVGVDASSVTATLSLEDGSAAAPASAPAAAPASAPSSSANSTTTTPVSRRLQSGTVNVAYEIEADMASSAMMTADLGATDGAALLTDAINEQLANVTGIDPVEVETLTAEPQVTITYEIRTTDAAAARTAQATMAAAASTGTGQDALLGGITQALADAGYAVTISSMSAEVEEVQTVEQGDAPPSRPSSNSAFRSGHRDVAAAVAVAVAVAAAL